MLWVCLSLVRTMEFFRIKTKIMARSAFHQTLREKFTFQQDNNIKHKAKYILEMLTKMILNVPEWPSYRTTSQCPLACFLPFFTPLPRPPLSLSSWASALQPKHSLSPPWGFHRQSQMSGSTDMSIWDIILCRIQGHGVIGYPISSARLTSYQRLYIKATMKPATLSTTNIVSCEKSFCVGIK